jgi:hypothetical protein
VQTPSTHTCPLAHKPVGRDALHTDESLTQYRSMQRPPVHCASELQLTSPG